MLELPHVIKLLTRNSETRLIFEYHVSFFHQQKKQRFELLFRFEVFIQR